MDSNQLNPPPLLNAGEIMNARLLAFSPDTPVVEAVSELVRRGYSGAPVVDGDGRLVGILSEIDCLQALSCAAFYAVPTGTVASYMTRDVQTVERHTDLLRLTYLLHERRMRRVPVVEDGRVIGLITRHDVLRALDKLRAQREQDQRRPGRSKYEEIEARRGKPT
jgi:CBS domain-containing protein